MFMVFFGWHALCNHAGRGIFMKNAKLYSVSFLLVLAGSVFLARGALWQAHSLGRSPASDEISARNKSELPRGIFTDPPEGGFFQMAAGLTDTSIATYLIRSSSKMATIIPLEAQMMNDARDDLLRAHKWPTTEAGKQELIQARQVQVDKIKDAISTSNGKSIYTKGDLKSAEASLQEAREMTLLTEKAKKLMIYNKEKALSECRAAGLEAVAAKSSKFAKTLKAVRVVGGTLFLADALGRVYVWNVVDASPSLSPAGSVFKKYTYDQIKALLWRKTSNGLVDAAVPENPSDGTAQGFLDEFEKQHEIDNGHAGNSHDAGAGHGGATGSDAESASDQ